MGWNGVADGRLGTVNARGDPCHGQQLPSALCFSSETLEVGFGKKLWFVGQRKSLN